MQVAEPTLNVMVRLLLVVSTFLVLVHQLRKHLSYLDTQELDSKFSCGRSILGIMNGSLLRPTVLRFGRNKSDSDQEVSLCADKDTLTGMNLFSMLMKSSLTKLNKSPSTSLPLSTKQLMMNHGDSENSEFSMRPKKNAPCSTLNADTRVPHSSSVVNLLISERTAFLLPSDLSRFLLKAELLSSRRLNLEAER
jgi:hypothetical protein